MPIMFLSEVVWIVSVTRAAEIVFEIGLEFLMIILLLTILAIALCFIFAGLLLSPRSSERTPRGISYAARSGAGVRTSLRPGVRRTDRIYPRSPQMARTGRVSRSYTQELERSRTWAGFIESINVGRVFRLRAGEKAPWIGLTLVLVALFGFSVVLLRTLLPDSAMIVASSWPDVAVSASPPVSNPPAKNSPADPFAALSGASKALVRIPQLDVAQYSNQQDYDAWAYSACSTASMTEIINSYGHNYRIADILKVEAGLHEITPDLGLLEPTGIDRTVAQFGFQTYWLNKPTIDDLVKAANTGHPVIIGFPPDRWSGGHLLVARGGDSKYVYLADSSRLNMQTMTRDTFAKYWAGFAVVVTPK